MFCIVPFYVLYLIFIKIITMNKILVLIVALSLNSCVDFGEPSVQVTNDINLTIDGENIDKLQGEWIITYEENDDDDQSVTSITIKKNELLEK